MFDILIECDTDTLAANSVNDTAGGQMCPCSKQETLSGDIIANPQAENWCICRVVYLCGNSFVMERSSRLQDNFPVQVGVILRELIDHKDIWRK
jgi:hypothetical protein